MIPRSNTAFLAPTLTFPCRSKLSPHFRSTRPACTRRRTVAASIDADVVPTRLPKGSESLENTHHNFSWSEQWYAVAIKDDVLPFKPYSFSLFAESLVLFRTKTSALATLSDKCACCGRPLSRGHVENRDKGASVRCDACGTSFDSLGVDGERQAVKAYGTATELGVVWVWTGDASMADRNAIPVPDRVRSGELQVLTTFMRYVPCSCETLVENLLDAAHVHFAHHNVRPGWNRKSPAVAAGGGEVQTTWPDGSFDTLFPTSYVRFRSPCVVWHEEQRGFMSTLFFSSVATPSTSRFVLILLGKQAPLFLRAVFRFTPDWMLHGLSHLVVDGDNVMLRSVEVALGEHSNWKKMYGPPAGKGDAGIVRYRMWMDSNRHAMPGGVATSELNPPAGLTRRQLLDRYHTHTIHCKACSGALRVLKASRTIMLAASWISFYALVAMFGLTLAVRIGPVSKYVLFWAKIVCVIFLLLFWRIRKRCETFIADLIYTEKARQIYLTE